MSDPRDIDLSDVPSVEDFDNEPTPLPAAPRVPVGIAVANEKPGWKPVTVVGGEMRGYEHLDTRLGQLASEMRDGFRMLAERILPTIERIERIVTDHNARIVEGEQRTRVLEDKVAALAKETAEHRVEIEKLKASAARRLKGKK